MVPVRDAGNASDTTGLGSVAYDYQIGTYEVTNAQYVEFLNAVAQTDTYGLYTPPSSETPYKQQFYGITRIGDTPGTYAYILKDQDYADKPVTNVTFYDAARFCNWLTNGQLTGAQDATTTESGLYVFSSDGMTIDDYPDHATATGWALPSNNEWYKAAYYKGGNTGDLSAGYWLFPTQSDQIDQSKASYYHDVDIEYLKVGGSYSFPSAYGTYDQAGNVIEWGYEGIDMIYHRVWGGGFNSEENDLKSTWVFGGSPDSSDINYGFRVVKLGAIPEPQTYALFGGMALLGMTLLRRRQK